MAERTCKTCGITFTAAHGRQIYCAPGCRQDWHPKVALVCDACNGPAIKYKQAQRYKGVYCSFLCRDYSRFGPLTCDLPAKHPARPRKTVQATLTPKPTFQCGRCNDCDALITEPSGQTRSKFCSTRCTRRVQKRRRRARESNAVGTFRYSEIMRQYRKQGLACAYCRKPCEGLPDPEHVLPLSRGGRNDISNLVAACRACNTDKSDLTLEEWVIDRARRNLPTRHTELIGPVYSHLALRQATNIAWRNAPTQAA